MSILTSSLSTRARWGAPRSLTWSRALCFWGPSNGAIKGHDDRIRTAFFLEEIQEIGVLEYSVSPCEGWGEQGVGIEKPPQTPPPSSSFPPPACCGWGCTGAPSTHPKPPHTTTATCHSVNKFHLAVDSSLQLLLTTGNIGFL